MAIGINHSRAGKHTSSPTDSGHGRCVNQSNDYASTWMKISVVNPREKMSESWDKARPTPAHLSKVDRGHACKRYFFLSGANEFVCV
jgi:hypothetical protein